MKILIGVQGTGNGHISRCHALAQALSFYPEVQTDFLVSGRAPEKLFDMEAFGDYQWRQGLSFQVRDGRVSVLDTLSHNPWTQFWQDVRDLDLSRYDLVVTDFEPVTAWAARRQGVRCIGLGRQYAFFKQTPALPTTLLQRAMLRQFAPCDVTVGMHWEDIGAHVLPPLIHQPAGALPTLSQEILVYLPFEPLPQVLALLQNFPEYQFAVYHPDAQRQDNGHIQCFPPSRQGFANAFARAEGVIANAGFETSSEALAYGKKLLVKPLTGQFEQLANAHCLATRQLAAVMDSLNANYVEQWLESNLRVRMEWPDAGPVLADWLANGAYEPVTELHQRLWQHTQRVALSA
ncbi:glycosyltransferase family protein [Aliidiomarina haloalkalitolerans]|uniref:Glycosyltransferase n=1 Tax=Aliidiomarina haloalkalitolerans TaxID=859059 RepID=A0A432VRZ0_9GAMM|nr:glycosyltransferase family protein [Aliidiomarina haloalkalitolerans]RUO19117.1 glycosyltransferase [Aliidiomarina haloalkalitolerans]